MALKFLNKKGWHTGSLRNIENVWKAEQKHEAEQKKLEELRLQIQQERERSEFRALQEQAGFAPRQERLEFLYDSGLAVGKGNASSSGHGVSFQTQEQPAKADVSNSSNDVQQQTQQSVPGALFEDKVQSANDAWRKLHSDPLLLIRQREQEALARIKNNPVKMALIRKSVKGKEKEKGGDRKEHKKEHHRNKAKQRKHSSSKHHSDSEEEDSAEEKNGRNSDCHKTQRNHDRHYERTRPHFEDESEIRESRRDTRHKEKYRDDSPIRHPERENHQRSDLDDEKRRENRRDTQHKEKYRDDSPIRRPERENHKRSDLDDEKRRESHRDTQHKEKYRDDSPIQRPQRENHKRSDFDDEKRRENRRDTEHKEKYRDHSPFQRSVKDNHKSYDSESRKRNNEDLDREKYSSKGFRSSDVNGKDNENGTSHRNSAPEREKELHHRNRRAAPKLTEEERAARLRQMQLDAELHEEQRWKRLKKADEAEAHEAKQNSVPVGKSFLDAAQKSVYGTEKGGSSTIEESVRRRAYYSQRGSEAEGNAFRR